MTYDQWNDLVEKVKSKFGEVKHGKEELPDEPGEREFVECVSPLGKLRLELWVRPRVLEKKTFYSHRMNSAATVQYQYDENEHTLMFRALHWNEAQGEWLEIDANKAAAAF